MNPEKVLSLTLLTGEDYAAARDAWLKAAGPASQAELAAADAGEAPWEARVQRAILRAHLASPGVALAVLERARGALPGPHKPPSIVGSWSSRERLQSILGLGPLAGPFAVELIWKNTLLTPRDLADRSSLEALFGALVAWSEPAVPAVLESLLAPERPPLVRLVAAETCGAARAAAAAARLTNLVGDASELAALRSAAVFALATIGDRTRAGALLRVLDDAEAPVPVRADCATALASLDPALARSELEVRLGQRLPGEVASRVASALGDIGDEETVTLLKQAADATASPPLASELTDAARTLAERLRFMAAHRPSSPRVT